MWFLAADIGPGCGRVLVPQNGKNKRGNDLFKSILRDEGATAFMKGWTASYLRIGPHTVISFILIEKVRQLFGMNTYMY